MSDKDIIEEATEAAYALDAHTIKLGRPTAYKREYAKQAEKLCKLGATDAELASFFEVSVRTIPRWAVQHEEFCQALKTGKEVADARVERSLFQRAVGFEMDAVKILAPKGSPKPVVVRYREVVAPDTTACIFWLKNRKKDEWRDKLDHEHSGSIDVKGVWSALAERGKARANAQQPSEAA